MSQQPLIPVNERALNFEVVAHLKTLDETFYQVCEERAGHIFKMGHVLLDVNEMAFQLEAEAAIPECSPQVKRLYQVCALAQRRGAEQMHLHWLQSATGLTINDGGCLWRVQDWNRERQAYQCMSLNPQGVVGWYERDEIVRLHG